MVAAAAASVGVSDPFATSPKYGELTGKKVSLECNSDPGPRA